MVQTPYYIKTNDSSMATLPSDSLVVESTSSRPSVSNDHSSGDVGRCTKELRVMTSIRSNHASSARLASVDSGRSEDDDGYCSRSSLDSPVQIAKLDNAACSGGDVDALESRMHHPAQSDSCLRLKDYSNCHHSAVLQSPADQDEQLTVVMELSSSCKSHVGEQQVSGDHQTPTTNGVTSLDHSYLLLPSSDADTSQNGVSAVAVDSVSDQSQKLVYDKASVQPLASLFGGIARNSSNIRRNFSVYVVPRAVQSASTASHCEAKLVPVAPVVSSRTYNRWNSKLCNGDPQKGSLWTVKKDFLNNSLDSLSYQVLDSTLSPSSALVQDNYVHGAVSSGENYSTSLKSSLAHRPDQFKPGVSTGRCRIALSDISRRSPVVGVSHQKGATSARTGSMYVRTPQSQRGSTSGGTLNRVVSRSSEPTLHLHPLVDHDYGAFATFNAEIQSSIISTTTDGASQMDWRSVRKNRLGRNKAYISEVSIVATPVERDIGGSIVETPPAVYQVRQKRKYCKRQPVIHDVIATNGPKLTRNTKLPGRLPGRKGRPPLSDSQKRLSIVKKRTVSEDISSTEGGESQNFVKIPGHYQDEFVYYATKRTRGRPRKQTDPLNQIPVGTESSAALVKPATSVGGINVFDWYREMAHTDKSSRFGTSCKSTPTNALPGTVHWTSGVSYSSADNGTPADESAVADLVMEMLPKTELVLGKDFRASSALCVDEFSSGASNFTIPIERSEMTVTEEDVCAVMLQSLNEADLKMIETQLGVGSNGQRNSITSAASGDASFVQYLPDYARDSLLSLSQTSVTSTSNGLLDVDEINDSDLLTADLGNMNVLLSDLSTPSRDVRVSNAPVVLRTNLSALFDLSSVSNADFGSASTSNSEPNTLAQTVNSPISASPPELITVNMFWNDVPGLLIRGKEYVRLVDIHRQMLPAKDTGILKKRCQMLVLDVLQCSELQRDFLIRYMNAAKSKSTAIVSRQDAIELIGFYVNPKSKAVRCDDNEASHDAESALNGKDKSMPSTLATNTITVNASQPRELHTSHTTPALPDQSCNNYQPLNSMPPNESLVNVKRSERLRDKHVRYADMVLGFHHRHSMETESENVDAQSRPKRSTDNDFIPLPTKVRRTSGEVKAGCEDDTRLIKESVACAKHISAVQHSHRTRLASSSECVSQIESNSRPCEQLKVEVASRQQHNHEKIAVCLQNDCIDTSENVSSQNSSEVAKTIVCANSEFKRNSMLQRVNRLHSRRRRRGGSLIKHSKSKNVSSLQTDDISKKNAFRSHESSSACEAFKENLSIEGHAANNADIHELKKDAVDNTDAQVGNNLDAHRSSVVDALEVADREPTVSCKSSDLDKSCEEDCIGCVLTPALLTPLSEVKPNNIVEVRHCDIKCRLGRRRRSQNGCIMLDRYTWSGARCVRCDTCCKIFSVFSFVGHMHQGSDINKLVTVNSLQRLEPRGMKTDEWHLFARLQNTFSVSCENSLVDSSHASHETSGDCKSDMTLGASTIFVSGYKLLSTHPLQQDANDGLPVVSSDHFNEKAESETPTLDSSPGHAPCNLRQDATVSMSCCTNVDVTTAAYEKVCKTSIRRSVRSSNSTLDNVSLKSRINCSPASDLCTSAVVGRGCERMVNMPVLPKVSKHEDLRSAETRRRLRQNYQRRSPPGATLPK